MKRLLDGALVGAGFVAAVTVAFAIAWAGDVFTVDKDGTLKFAVSDQGKITVGATESYVNLVIQNNAAAANNKVDITADVLTVEGIRLENVNVSADITVSGAGGLDTGAEASNTWYYIWVVTNNTGSSVNGLISTSSTSPTLPSGYTKKRRVGAVRNDASSNFLQFVQEETHVIYKGYYTILSAGQFPQSSGKTAVSATEYVPPTSRRADVLLRSNIVHNTVGISFLVRAAGDQNYLTYLCDNMSYATGKTAAATNQVDGFQLDDSRQIWYSLENVPSTSGGAYISINGYYDRI